MSEIGTLDNCGPDRGGSGVELGLLAERYVSGRVRRGEIGRLTARNHRCILSAVTATYGDRPAKNFRRLHIDRWLENEAGLKPSTRRTHLSVVRGFTAWLVREGHIRRDPTEGVKRVRQPRTVPRAMPSGDVGRLLQAVPDSRARAIVSLGVWCGLRCVEIANLLVEDWDRTRNVIRVTGKFGNERELPLPDDATRHLRDYLVDCPATVGPLIRSHRRGRPWEPVRPQTVSKLVGIWMAAAGVKATPRDGISAHALRHTAASDVLDECGDLRVVMEMLGHQNLATTSIYLRRANIPQLRTAMNGRTYRQELT